MEEKSFRDQIAKTIAVSVIIATGVLGALGVCLAVTYIIKDTTNGVDEAREMLQFIFSSLLPLWGTWIGTVLAYYFSKENFESANKQVRELVNQVKNTNEKLNSLPVTEVMMPFDKIKKIEVPANGDPDKLIIQELYNQLVKDKTRRALIFVGRRIVYVLHKSLLSDFLFRNPALPASSANPPTPGGNTPTGGSGGSTPAGGGNPPAPAAPPAPTITDMKNDKDKDILNAFVNGVAIVAKSATLLDVKNLMDNFVGCQDVFVTETGKRDEDVLGWISNVDVMEKTKA